jgi:hypothetical protein
LQLWADSYSLSAKCIRAAMVKLATYRTSNRRNWPVGNSQISVIRFSGGNSLFTLVLPCAPRCFRARDWIERSDSPRKRVHIRTALPKGLDARIPAGHTAILPCEQGIVLVSRDWVQRLCEVLSRPRPLVTARLRATSGSVTQNIETLPTSSGSQPGRPHREAGQEEEHLGPGCSLDVTIQREVL